MATYGGHRAIAISDTSVARDSSRWIHMEYVYAAMILHTTDREINEENLTAVLEAAGTDVAESRVKALVAALEDVDIDEAIADAAAVPAGGAVAPADTPAAGGAEGPADEEAAESEAAEAEDEAEEEEEEASGEGLGELFG
jgi:large subunit ribosomal protein L12